jgi:hypothetical protein
MPCQAMPRFHNQACRRVYSREPTGHLMKGGPLAARKVLWGVTINQVSTTRLGPFRPSPPCPPGTRAERRRPTQRRRSCRTGQAIGHIITWIRRRHHCPKMSLGKAAAGPLPRDRRCPPRQGRPLGAGQREARLTGGRVGRRRPKKSTATRTSRADNVFFFSDK